MTEVVIVGAGPAGLAAAINLARAGIECLVVEKRREWSTLPRATVVSVHSMELVRAWGLEDEVLAGGNDVEWLMLECETLAQAAAGNTHAVGYPTKEQSAVVSPTSPACVPQDHLEAVMRAYVQALGVRVEVGTEVRDIVTRPHGSRLTVGDVQAGTNIAVEARYVIAADGAYSRVRSALRIPMSGEDQLRDAIMVEFRAPLWDVVGPHRHGIYAITHPGATGSLLPAGVDDRWLYGFEWDPACEQFGDYDESRLRRRLELATGVPDLALRIERVGAFSFAAQIAERFRADDVFLVGDAAHRITPRGGTGMNTALGDGADLGWKLAWVLRGWASPSLLDTYETERRPIAEHNLARSADPAGSRRDALGELRVDLGGRIAHAWIANGTRSTLDLLGEGLTLFTGADPAPWQRAAARLAVRVPIGVEPLAPITSRAMGIPARGALLARPDGVPVAVWSAPIDAAGALSQATAFLGAAHAHAA